MEATWPWNSRLRTGIRCWRRAASPMASVRSRQIRECCTKSTDSTIRSGISACAGTIRLWAFPGRSRRAMPNCRRRIANSHYWQSCRNILRIEGRMNLLITGGAGFIGSAVVRLCLGRGLANVAVYDSMTYAASPQTLAAFEHRTDFVLFQRDICDPAAMRAALQQCQPDAIMHLAAESHVDRSIEKPAAFVQTNVVGTQVLLDAALAYWRELDP